MKKSYHVAEAIVYLTAADVWALFEYPTVVTDFARKNLFMKEESCMRGVRIVDGMDIRKDDSRYFLQTASAISFLQSEGIEITEERARILCLR